MKRITLFFIPWLVFLSGCIGDDIIFDTVEESLRIIDKVDTLAVGGTYLFSALYTNNIGMEEAANIQWISADPEILEIFDNGEAVGRQKGSTIVTARVGDIRDEVEVVVDQETVVSTGNIRSGEIRTTSSYILEGSFELSAAGPNLLLSVADDYRASSSLPGLYLYLTNNPNTTNGAYEIGEVKVFEGAHSYEIDGTEVRLDQYSHLLYFCKPFRVKVGDAEIN